MSMFTLTIDLTGRLTFDLGPIPDPHDLERVRALAASMGGLFVAEAACTSPEDREAIAQRLATMLLRGGAS